jgi:hypothetical protein
MGRKRERKILTLHGFEWKREEVVGEDPRNFLILEEDIELV